MRGWSELAPYNFIHALRLEEPLDLVAWRRATEAALQSLELGTAPVMVETPSLEIDQQLDRELNRAFAPGELPVRFFALHAAGGHWFGVVLDHWVADDFSARALLERIYALRQSRELPPLRRAAIFRARKNLWREGSAFLRQARGLRRAARPSYRDPLDFTARCFQSELPASALEAVRQLARRQHATIHDVFLAAAAQACGAMHLWKNGARRDSIGVASAMDLRRFLAEPAHAEFGLLISEYSIAEPHPENVSLPELVGKIATKTCRLKKISNSAVPAAGWLFWRLARSRSSQATMFQRGAPLMAGLSNVNLSGSWLETEPIAEFRRVVTTGPAVPIVLMITTRRGRIFVDTTYRTTAFTRADAENLLADFGRRLLADAYQPLPGSA
ncbi:MAG: hypothetical protein ABI992_04165 [Chthoniobacterales bacterium]